MLKWFLCRHLALELLIVVTLIYAGYAKPTLEVEVNTFAITDTPTVNEVEMEIEIEESTVETVAVTETVEVATPNVEENIISSDHEYRRQYAKKMLTYMNLTVDPCDDFYEYACGNWKHVIAERQAQHKRSNLLDIAYRLNEAVEELLKSSADALELDYVEELRLAQMYYDDCLTAQLHPMPRSEEYLKVIRGMGGFPAVDADWQASNFSWFNMSAQMSNYGVSGLVREEVLPQFPFPPYFKIPELGFDYIVQSDNIATNTSRGYELNAQRMREYLTTYGVPEERVEEIIVEVFDFLRAVLQVIDEFDGDKILCNEVALKKNDLQEFTEWSNYYQFAWVGKEFNVRDTFCPCDYFYVKLDAICKKHPTAVANYLAMKFLFHMDARLKNVKFQKEYCLMNLQNSMTYLIDKLYLKKYFNKEIRMELSTIVQETRKSLRLILQEADWLDEITRTEALLKESTITMRVGNFDDPEMSDRLIRAMNNLTFVTGNYEQNNMNLKKFKTFIKRYNGLHFEKLKNDTKPLELLVGMQVNSFYYNVDNSINVMPGVLHPPAYHKSWPNSLKFGTIGYLVGHELTHGFDSVGANFDSVGNELYWWSNKSSKVFNERANCYIDHYNSYVIPEINRNINGNVTMDENIADGGGLLEALNAYRRYMKDLSKQLELTTLLKEEQMPGMDLSPEQLFFLGFAQVWCASYEEEHYWEELNLEHTIDKYRVLGAVTNTEDFAKAYNCPLGSKMHPKADKCKLW